MNSALPRPGSLTSRDRVRAALEHRPPDRPPVDLGTAGTGGISASAYARLRHYLDLDPLPVRVCDPLQRLALVDEDVLDRFGVDTIDLSRAFPVPDEQWAYWVLPDGLPCLVPKASKPERDGRKWLFRGPRSGRVVAVGADEGEPWQPVFAPFADREDLDELPALMPDLPGLLTPMPPGAVRASLSKGAARLRANHTARAIVAPFGGELFQLGQLLYGPEQFLALLANEPARGHALLERALEIHLANLDRFLVAVGPFVDVLLFADDLGTPQGPGLSPDLYREFFQERHRQLWTRAKELADVKVLLRCRGGVHELLPSLIEAGLDALGPVPTHCPGMEAARLKAEFGDRLAFWGGGCDTDHVLRQGTPAEVAEHVRRQREILTPGGGFVFHPNGPIPAMIAPAQIVALFETGAEA